MSPLISPHKQHLFSPWVIKTQLTNNNKLIDPVRGLEDRSRGPHKGVNPHSVRLSWFHSSLTDSRHQVAPTSRETLVALIQFGE